MLQKLVASTSVLVLLVAATSCSTDPAVAKKKHVDAGARYLKAAKYREAVLEYRSAIRIDGAYPEARLGLAETYERAGDLQNAYREYRPRRRRVACTPGYPAPRRQLSARSRALRGRRREGRESSRGGTEQR